MIARDFPHIPAFDYFMNFPDGAKPPWPPLYDLLIAAVAWTAGLGLPSQRLVETVAAVMPPVLGALTVLPVFFFSRRLFDERIALWGAFFFSLVPGHIQYTFVGRPDHHAIEPLVLMIFSLMVIISLETRSRGRHPRLMPVLGGVVLAAGILVWTGSIIYLAVILFALMPLVVMHCRRGENPAAPFRSLLLTSLTAALLLSLYLVITNTWSPYSYIDLSGFHAFLLYAAALFAAVLWYASQVMHKKELSWAYLPAAIISVVVSLLVLTYVLFPAMLQPLADGVFTQIGKSAEWRKSIVESRPLFSVLTVRGYEFSIGNAVNRAGWAVLLMPPALVLLFLKRNRNAMLVFFAFWSIPFLVLALNQMRYLYYAAVPIGLLTAWLMVQAVEVNVLRKYTVVIPLAFTALFYPTFDNALYNFRESGGGSTLNPNGMDAIRTMLWIRDNTPPPIDPASPAKKPDYGIMSTWGFGHEISYISQRPVVSNNFGDVLKGRGFPDSMRFYTSTSVEESYAILTDHDARYVFLAATDYYSAMAAKMSGKKMPGYFNEAWSPTSKAFREIVVFRLYFLDGADIGRLRLVYESGQPYLYEHVRKCKIFEFVPGARLTGSAPQGSTVSVSLPLISNQGREFNYENTATADKNGFYEILLPYSTEGTSYQVRPRHAYMLRAGGKTKMINVREKDVLAGGEIHAD